MKLPAAALVAAFAAGCGVALFPVFAAQPPGSKEVALLALLVAGTIATGLLVLHAQHVRSAAVFSMAAWFLLGCLTMRAAQQPLPANHVLRLIVQQQLDTSAPLHWRGHLRNDPERLPWGLGYEVELESAEAAGRTMPVQGGLRMSYFLREGAGEPVELRAGDRVEALAQARLPNNYKNPGSFDRRAYLARQDIHLTATLRAPELLRLVDHPAPSLSHRLARARGRLLHRLDELAAAQPHARGILRAMLLGDRAFVDRPESAAFQKSATYHVLVLAGLHVTALAIFLLWMARVLRLPRFASTLLTLTALAAYAAIVESRPPILRAVLMAGLLLFARLLFRRMDLLHSAALAALLILVAQPLSLTDPSFQLSFLAVGTIGALATPWLGRTSAPLRRSLEHLQDVTRDAAYAPRLVQFRLDLRDVARWLGTRLPKRLGARAHSLLTLPLRAAFRLWELVALSFVLQCGMLPLLAHYFHRVSLAGPLANVPAVTLTGILVPLGFAVLGISFFWSRLAHALAPFFFF